ncbi:MAG: lipoate--protein ligase family protein [Anaerolineales bacterium]|nr:lipoate--protein ligase family protein [Anaerolineales bacterium]
MKPIRLINLGAVPPWQTQAIYHALAERMDDEAQDTIVLCRPNEPYLCLGYHQVFESIFDPAECARRGLPVYRRRLGGGATYLDENQIFYQCIFHHTHLPVMLKDIYSSALAAPVNTLRGLGLSAELRETNEIEVNGRRIAGTGGGRIEDAAIVVGNILFDFDYEAMTAVWQTPWPSFRLLAQKALHQRIITMKDLAMNVSMEQVTDLLIESFATSMGRELELGELTPEEWQAAEEEAKELASPDYLALHKTNSSPEPMRTLKISARAFIRYDEVQMDGYGVRGSFWLSDDVIQEVILQSTPERDWSFEEEKLRGILFSDWKENIEL